MLTLLGLALVIISTIYIYRTAKQNGHNAVLWTLVSAIAGVALQLVIPIIISTVIAGVWAASGKPLPQIQEELMMPALIITVICLILNFVVVALIMKKVSPLAEEKFVETPPPPPTDFNING